MPMPLAGWTRIDASLQAVRAQARQGALLREGLTVVLIGQPNVGKSSLLNQLAGFEAAIVTEIAGTTRDTVREAIQIQGVPLHIIDTAGLRDTDDAVEKLGIARTWAAVEKADVALLLVDAAHGLSAHESAILQRLPGVNRLTIHNKIDVTQEAPRAAGDEIWLSAKTGAGVDLLRGKLLEAAGWQAAGEGAFMARARHLDALGPRRASFGGGARIGRATRVVCRGVAAGTGGAVGDHRRIYRRRFAGRNFQQILHRKMTTCC